MRGEQATSRPVFLIMCEALPLIQCTSGALKVSRRRRLPDGPPPPRASQASASCAAAGDAYRSHHFWRGDRATLAVSLSSAMM